MKLTAVLAIGLVAALGAFLVSGCCMPSGCSDLIGQKVSDTVQKGVEKGIEDSTNTTIDTEKTTEATGEDLKSVPRYPGATRTLYIKGEPIDGNISVSINYETTDSASKVVSWYKDKMAGLGWTVSMTVSGTDGGEMITYGKNNNETTATVNVSKSGDKTDIGIMYNGAESGA
ncbi:MAG: hypothetical protein WC891_02140 [Actinomycetota bacterium]